MQCDELRQLDVIFNTELLEVARAEDDSHVLHRALNPYPAVNPYTIATFGAFATACF